MDMLTRKADICLDVNGYFGGVAHQRDETAFLFVIGGKWVRLTVLPADFVSLVFYDRMGHQRTQRAFEATHLAPRSSKCRGRR